MVNVLDYDIVLKKFELQSRYYVHLFLGLVGRVFANGPGDRGSIPDRVIPKT